MLAAADPDRTLDTRRLSEFSPGRENSHGAGSVCRIQLHQCSQPPTVNRRPQTLGQRALVRAQPNARDPLRPNQAALRNLSAACAVRWKTGDILLFRHRKRRMSPVFHRSGAVPGAAFGSGSGEHIFLASRDRTRKPPRPPPHERMAGEQRDAVEEREPNPKPSNARRGAGSQPERAALMRALTAPMSVRPAAFALTAAMTLPMSLTDAAPVVAIASWMIASTSAGESCVGR